MATRSKPKRPVNAEYATKAPSEVHEAFAAFITSTTGVEVDAATVGLVQRVYPLFLKSPEVTAARDAAKAERENARAQREAVKKAKLQARLDRIEAERQRVLKSLGVPDDGPALSLVGEEVTDESEEVTEPDEDGEPEAQAEEATLTDESEDADDDWGDDDSDELDEEDF